MALDIPPQHRHDSLKPESMQLTDLTHPLPLEVETRGETERKEVKDAVNKKINYQEGTGENEREKIEQHVVNRKLKGRDRREGACHR